MGIVVTRGTAPLNWGGKFVLAAEILASYFEVRWQLRRNGLREAVTHLRRPARKPTADPRDAEMVDTRRLARAVVLTLEPLPADSRCLMRSLVLLRVLARRSLATQLVIAVKEPACGAAVDAHAWIERDGEPLLWPGDSAYQRLLSL